MTLIRDIQAAAISATTDLPTLLRMCKLLAARLGTDQLATWVEHELNGYPSIDSLPPYRVATVDSYGQFQGPYQAADRLQLSVGVLPKNLQDHYRHAYMLHGVSVYSGLVAQGGAGMVTAPWPLGLALKYASKLTPDMQCIAAWQEIPIPVLGRLLDTVRNRVLDYAIALERESPEAGDMPIGSQPVSSEKLTHIYNTNIAGNVGNLSNAGRDFSQTSTMSVAGDWPALQASLEALGLRAQDYEGLQAELEQESKATPPTEARNKITERWLGKLATRAASGAAGIAIEIGATAIAKAIAGYFGLG